MRASGPVPRVWRSGDFRQRLVEVVAIGQARDGVVPRRVRFTAKATIFANPLAAWLLTRVGVVPLRRSHDETTGNGAPDPTRNAAAFDAVADALAEQSAIVIFPEGKSHDDPHLAPLRTGLARMVWHAADTRGVQHVRIVPMGLLFEEKERPRSRILVRVGEPIVVDAVRQRTGAAISLVPWNETFVVPPEADLLVNATSIGLYPHGDDMPDISLERARPDLLVSDVVFNPPETPLLRAARERGHPTLDGLSMLVYQGVIGFELWTGRDAPEAVMKEALKQALGLA